MSDIVLTAGVRQNLLSLQNTAALMATTQNRLATGKKVNSALDNPSNFFTSQVLNNRASDLNGLLDSIGQAQKTLEAADQGITSLTKMVQSAKSIATQARQTATANSSFSAVNNNSTIPAETLGTITGAVDMSPMDIAISQATQSETLGRIDATGATGFAGAGGTVDTGNGGNLVITVNGTDYTVAVADSDTESDVINSINALLDTSGAGLLHAEDNAGKIRLTATTADADFSINTGSSTVTLAAIGFDTTTGSGTSTSLLDRIVAAGGIAGTTDISVTVNGGTAATKTFGTAAGQISTLDELNTWLSSITTGGLSAGVATSTAGTTTSGTISFDLAKGQTTNLTISSTGGTSGALNTALGGSGIVASHNSTPTLADLGVTSGGNLVIAVDKNDGTGFSTQTIGLAATDRLDDIVTKLKANATLNNNLDIVNNNGMLKITAKNADVDFKITDNAVGQAVGVTAGGGTITKNSTSLLDQLAVADGSTLTIGVNGGTAQTITFGTAVGEISTSAEFATALASLGGVTATLTGTALNIQVASGNSQTSLTIGGTAGVVGGLNLVAGTTSGTETLGTDNATRASLQADYNSTLEQMDALAKDASYNGINLLYGDDLKIVFNENGSSSLTISGVTFDSAGLGIPKANGSGFQDNTTIDATLAALDTALNTLRTQASKFGSNLTTVQTRQDFTKGLINTLQTGADNLVLADSNEEGANMLALQTRQQLSTTALSLANQASQAVLRLFG